MIERDIIRALASLEITGFAIGMTFVGVVIVLAIAAVWWPYLDKADEAEEDL